MCRHRQKFAGQWWRFLPRCAEARFLSLGVFCAVVGVGLGIWGRSGVPAYVGPILGMTLAFGVGVRARLVKVLTG